MTRHSDKYTRFFSGEFLMGPNSIYLLDELLMRYPLGNTDGEILDLGCGKGLTSLFLANETGAAVYANDLWISGEENARRFKEWGAADRIIPCREDANCLTFEKEKFSALVSVDAYHYFAGEKGFFREKILPFMKPGGIVLIAVPGIKDEYEGRQKELLSDWLGDDSGLFRSCGRWREIIDFPADVWEMENFSPAWESWLSLDNEFANGDRAHFDSIISRYTCFVGIAVRT